MQLLTTGNPWRARLRGGPADAVGEVEPARDGLPPATLTFTGEHVYARRAYDAAKRKVLYDYDPTCPGHRVAVMADAAAVAEVAAAQGVPVAQVLARAAEGRRRAAGNPHPADALLTEAARRGVSPEVLIAEHNEAQQHQTRSTDA